MIRNTVRPGITTSLITGSTGSGKTAYILQRVSQKPAGERWAILLNKYGNSSANDKVLLNYPDASVFCQLIQGGCICCTFSLQLQSALNRLLSASNPDRLLIELPAIADIKQVIKLLSQPWYKTLLMPCEITTVIDGQATVVETPTQTTSFLQFQQVCR
jgi:G3E family GTPase